MGGYGFEDLECNDLTIENILSRVSEVMLWRHYLGCDFVLGRTISAPYRKDNSPSFCLFINYQKGVERIYGKDFGTGWYGDVINFVQLLFRTDFYSALVKINLDFNLGFRYNGKSFVLNSPTRIETKVQRKELEKFEKVFKSKSRVLRIRPRIYTKEDLAYWASYGISKDILKQYRVYPIQELWSNPDSEFVRYPIYTYDPKNPGYAYHFEGTNHLKCYWPFSPNQRFDGNIDNFTDIQGYYQCRVKEDYEGKLLVLTKSMKDCMTLRTFNIDAMAIHGETHKFHPDFIRHIKKYYPVIISLYDKDKAGVKGARDLWKEHKIIPFFIPKGYGSKDVSDMYKMYGRDEVDEFLDSIRRALNQKTTEQRYA